MMFLVVRRKAAEWTQNPPGPNAHDLRNRMQSSCRELAKPTPRLPRRTQQQCLLHSSVEKWKIHRLGSNHLHGF